MQLVEKFMSMQSKNILKPFIFLLLFERAQHLSSNPYQHCRIKHGYSTFSNHRSFNEYAFTRAPLCSIDKWATYFHLVLRYSSLLSTLSTESLIFQHLWNKVKKETDNIDKDQEPRKLLAK